jgi:class 3 adenylate cyclase
MEAVNIDQIREAERIEEIRATIEVISNRMVIPLYFLFWLCDLLYMPELKWTFLGMRTLVIPILICIRLALPRIKTYKSVQIAAMAYTFGMAVILSAMIYLSKDPGSPYYAGLNLVAIGSLSFIPYNMIFYWLTVAAIFAPYYAVTFMMDPHLTNLSQIAIYSFFITGTTVISFGIRYFNERLRKKELISRLQLNEEVRTRDAIIKVKTDEALNLATLSKQFSPQVVDAIQNGQINIQKGVHRSNICAIVIDIVNSTERVLRVDKDKVHKAISMFMEDTMRILLKYDITIDKFMGDGILAFSNDPAKHDDYVDRAVSASLEIRDKIQKNADLYENYWMNRLQIRVGIAVGFANVGFYGNDRYYQSYTAIGPVVNLASRLCAAGDADKIHLSHDAVEALIRKDYSISFIGKKTLKGFESDVIKVYDVTGGTVDTLAVTDEIDCPSCKKGLMFLDNDVNGIFILKCRSCGYVHNSDDASKKKAA